MATYPAGWASWHWTCDWEFALGLLRAAGERSDGGEYPRAPGRACRSSGSSGGKSSSTYGNVE